MANFDYLNQNVNHDDIKKFNDHRESEILNQSFKPFFFKESDITILPELEQYIRKQKEDELEQFKESIQTEGIRDALVVANLDGQNILIDGHHRFRVGSEVGIKDFPCKKVELGNLEEIKVWMLKNQLGRRNLTDAERIDIALKLTGFLSEKAKENQESGVGLNLAKGEKSINTNQEVANLANVSRANVTKFNKIKNDDPNKLQEVLSGEKTIHKAYTELNKPAEIDLTQTAEQRASYQAKELQSSMKSMKKIFSEVNQSVKSDDKASALMKIKELIKFAKAMENQLKE